MIPKSVNPGHIREAGHFKWDAEGDCENTNVMNWEIIMRRN
jgi:hypothetical protein